MSDIRSRGTGGQSFISAGSVCQGVPVAKIRPALGPSQIRRQIEEERMEGMEGSYVPFVPRKEGLKTI